MKKTLAILAFSTLLLLGACVYDHHPNGVPYQHGGFCPPGQAKKGNC